MGVYWVVVAIAAPMFLWSVISPQSQWRTLAAWRFRNPKVFEPSEMAYKVQRVVAVIGLVGMVGMVVGGIAFQNVLDDMQSDPFSTVGGDPYISDCDLYAPGDPLC